MNYINTKEAAKKWGMTERSVRSLCQNGRVPNVKRSGRSWLIPDNADRPLIGLKRASHENRERFDLFLNPTYDEYNSLSSITPEEFEICRATDDIMKGHFEAAEQRLLAFTKNCTKDNYLAVAYATLCYSCLSSKSDSSLYNSLLKDYCKLLQRNEDFKFGCVIARVLFKDKEYQSTQIKNATLPEDMLPLVVCYHICQLVVDSIAGRTAISLEQIELLCRLAPVEEHPALLLFIHINMCTGYFYKNDTEAYSYHLEQALKIALPRKWYYPFAAYSYPNSWIEIKALDEEAYKEIQQLADLIIGNYIANGFFKSSLRTSGRLSATTLRVAIFLSKGLSNTKIAKALDITLYEVKKCIKEMYKDTGLNDRDELAEFIRFHLKML